MSAASRFIMLAVTAWIGLRAASLGLLGGGQAIAFDRPASGTTPLPAIATTRFAAPDPVAPAPLSDVGPPFPQAYAYPYAVPVYPAGLTRPMGTVARAGTSYPTPTGWGPDETQDFSLSPAVARYANVKPLEQWPIAAIAGGASVPAPPATAVPVAAPAVPGLDRLSMSAWALMRREPGAPGLATNGQLGGSQAGARFLWRFDRRLALSVRSSAPIGGIRRSVELAAGVRLQPFPSIPVALTAERRQDFGRDKGPSAFALFAEGGIYDRPIVAGFNLDGWLQAGVVGIRDRAAFVDGSAALTRPVWRSISAGVGMWGGAQPGLARLDAGPRATLRVGGKMRVHLDYRHRFVGKAAPGSGPVVTLSGIF